MTILNTPIQLKNGKTLKNRLFKGAMSEQLTPTLRPTEDYVQLYETWAKGGAGVLVTGNVMIDKTALGSAKDVVIEDDSDLAMLKRWARAGTQNGTTLLMQINHPGKQSPKDLSPEPVAPSAIGLSGNLGKFFNPPRALTESEILDLIQRFALVASVAGQAGFSGVQIHAAHGYLISQFLSPVHNQRQDQWGGSLANRMRFLLEIYRAMRTKTSPDFIIAVKLNSADFQKGGFSEEESVQVVEKLVAEGIDLVEISGGNYESPTMLEGVKESTQQREAYFLDYAKKVRHICTVPLVITGGFRSQSVMEKAIESNEVDLIGIAKPFAILPNLPNRIFAGNYQTLDLKPIRTGVKKIDDLLGSMIEMGWYMYQMALISQGKASKPQYSAWWILLKMLFTQGFRRERA
ncbi:NADH:flavin oxidoreductase/NADH oxidase family protein [Actinobacillus suis]|uniref:FMN oxidoreductase CC3083 n=2 Tax=Actinobacillus suis TaxID=716 RepID=K0G6E9_ACTSU|nr:NADH:flavin oxidoreductase/NADH oxidase family protein [Actinobacillus suis]AFU19693.1 FMN oxidoreductase CC3083 [Actinobacillus suis H91-0380]AIJ31831.1 FMN oxidoreductase CC3083 [Actinobacillus suis ATCC 33415]MCO4169536.1 NADH:flavin oxidoreductase/NADH oxidase family protein [Actinobacillus suis]MCQ9629299.1 NADH:flavin oxidoreductase/NADH oxidase family protein [Actinobacillus suis]MCQ9632349.1 NADH:flavin oxidoreductase/NADH oxidase family protein [Actinobacillus suis]